jgi:hypothetical protein
VVTDDLSKLLTPMMSGFKKEQVFKKEDTHYKRRRYNDFYGVKAAEIAIERSVKKMILLF